VEIPFGGFGQPLLFPGFQVFEDSKRAFGAGALPRAGIELDIRTAGIGVQGQQKLL
jgi:hypothetical protein